MNIGEKKAMEYLAGGGWRVEDTTANPAYFDKDIDFIARRDNEEITIEVKWDSRIAQTGNMFVEEITDIDK